MNPELIAMRERETLGPVAKETGTHALTPMLFRDKPLKKYRM
jgi:hypothetical protein